MVFDMVDSIFGDEKSSEWVIAKQKLTNKDGTLLKNGSKLRRKDSGLKHSFLVIDDQILAVAEKGKYLGKGHYGVVKLAENEAGELFAIKQQAPSDFDKDKEAEITHDLGISGRKATRRGGKKEYLACQYLGKTLHSCYEALDKNLSLDGRYALLIKIALKLHALHIGSNSKTSTGYLHGDLHLNNIVIDDKGDVHLIDFGRSHKKAEYLIDKNSKLVNKDTSMFLQEYVYKAQRFNPGAWRGFLGVPMSKGYEFSYGGVPLNQFTISISLAARDEKTGLCTTLKYTKYPAVIVDEQNFTLNDLERGEISLGSLGLNPMNPMTDDVLGALEKVRDKVLKTIEENGYTLLEESPDRNQLVIRLATENNATALEIAETLTLCRFHLEPFQSELMKRTSAERLMLIHVLNAQSEKILTLYDECVQRYGEDSDEVKKFKTLLVKTMTETNDPADKVNDFLTSIGADNEALKEPINTLVQAIEQAIESDKKCAQYEQSLYEYRRQLSLLKHKAPATAAKAIDTLQTALMGNVSTNEPGNDATIQALIKQHLEKYDAEKLTAMVSLERLERTTQSVYFDDQYSALRNQASKAYEAFKVLIESGDDLVEINTCILTVLETVKRPSEENIKKLEEMSLAAQSKTSPYWKAAGVILMALGAAMLAAGLALMCATGLAIPLGVTVSVVGAGVVSAGVTGFFRGKVKDERVSQSEEELHSLAKKMRESSGDEESQEDESPDEKQSLT